MGAQKKQREERGGDTVAHREDGERVSVLEEGLTASKSQLRSPVAEEEDEVEDDASALFRSPESTERATEMIRSSWTAQGEEGEAVAAAAASGGDELCSVGERGSQRRGWSEEE